MEIHIDVLHCMRNSINLGFRLETCNIPGYVGSQVALGFDDARIGCFLRFINVWDAISWTLFKERT